MRAVPPSFQNVETGVWLSPGAHVVHYPVRGGAELAVVVIADDTDADTGWGQDVPATFVETRVAHFYPELTEMIATASNWRKWALFRGPPTERCAIGRVALIGDAAHPILPFLAQGGVMALEDAATLAQAVAATPDDLAAAFDSYQTKRMARVARVQAASERNGQIYHLAGPLASARDLALRALPAARIMAGYDWLYGWRADR